MYMFFQTYLTIEPLFLELFPRDWVPSYIALEKNASHQIERQRPRLFGVVPQLSFLSAAPHPSACLLRGVGFLAPSAEAGANGFVSQQVPVLLRGGVTPNQQQPK